MGEYGAVEYASVILAALLLVLGATGAVYGYHEHQESEECVEKTHLYAYEVENSSDYIRFEALNATQQEAVRLVASGEQGLSLDLEPAEARELFEHDVKYNGSYYRFTPDAVECGGVIQIAILLISGATALCGVYLGYTVWRRANTRPSWEEWNRG